MGDGATDEGLSAASFSVCVGFKMLPPQQEVVVLCSPNER